jgi:CTP synthase
MKDEDEKVYQEAWETIHDAHGVVIPGGFGKRGVEGKILAAKYCRQSKKPFLGICLGMQVCCAAHASSVLRQVRVPSPAGSQSCPVLACRWL